TCSHTNQQTNPWWSVDLHGVYNITCICQCQDLHRELSSRLYLLGNLHMEINVKVQNITAFLSNQINVYEFPSSMSRRYVTVIRPENTFMVLCDVKITGTKMENSNKPNIQLMDKRAYQSTTYTGIDEIHYTADRALDGNQSTCSHTNQQIDPWWSVDLQDVYNISCISIYNVHQDNKVTNISGAKIYIGNSRQNNGINNKLVQNITAFLANQINVFEFPSSVSGRYVTVIRPGNTFMVLCDVKITGTKMG
uniref:Fucolectin tachylectin-4 pentraxin-1 domain-containing protein n=1 Tax=Poecilia formosa TaxID=48698 RepID=A0A087YMC5_POEFO